MSDVLDTTDRELLVTALAAYRISCLRAIANCKQYGEDDKVPHWEELSERANKLANQFQGAAA